MAKRISIVRPHRQSLALVAAGLPQPEQFSANSADFCRRWKSNAFVQYNRGLKSQKESLFLLQRHYSKSKLL